MKTETQLKTPITYYGGKQMMLRHILPLIPQHNLYCEPFCGGAAVYWAKPPSRVEVINDTNELLINFYRVLQNDFEALFKEVKATLHSRKMFMDAWSIYNDPRSFDPVMRAWAVYTLASQSFGSQLKGSWGYDRKKGSVAIKVMNKKRAFTYDLHERIERTQIDCRDALSVIKAFDSPESFFYIDPPYPGTNQGHYTGYMMDDLESLLSLLSSLKGKFLLSNYPQEIIDRFVTSTGWHKRSFKMLLCASKSDIKRKKTEVLVANYPI
jgi:DNA adenine methylase